MTPAHYTAKVLPDGHLPLPKYVSLKAGDEVEVTVAPIPAVTDEMTGTRQRDHGLKHLAGIGHSGLTDIAEKHDEYLFKKRQGE